MSEQAIVERIISDAEKEAAAIIAAAEKKAETTVSEANVRAERRLKGERELALARERSVLDVKAAAARLDCAKILLSEKRAVIDEVYARALKEMLLLGKAETLRLLERLLTDYAEDGDEIIFADGFRYVSEAEKLSVVKDKKLKISPKRAAIDGGCLLTGVKADKDLSYAALLAADREQMQAEIAAKIFSV